MATCVVIAAGQLCGDFSLGAPAQGDLVLCCDSGLDNAERLGVRPHAVVGDFDSLARPVPAGIEVLRHPPEKDDTDLLLALKLGLQRGYRCFLLVAVTGGRLDHTVAALQALAFLLERGAQGRIVGGCEEIHMLRCSSILLPQRPAHTLSVFAYGGSCAGVTLTGVRYPLDNATLTPAFPLGISNEITSPAARVTVTSGTLLVIQSRL